MKDKEKQIEEMAKVMQKCYEKNGLLNFKWFAESAYKYLTENSVVLSREEYEKIKSLPNKIIKYMDRHLGDGELSGNVLRNCAKQFGVEIKEA